MYLALTGADPNPRRQPQEQTPANDPNAEVEIKPQLKPRVSVATEEDPNPSHQLYKLQIKSTRSLCGLGRLCIYGIYKRPLRVPTRENALALIAVDIGDKNTEESDQIRI